MHSPRSTTCVGDPAGAAARCDYTEDSARDGGREPETGHSRRAREIYRRHSSGIGGPPLPCCAAVKRRAACCAAVSSLDLTAHTRPYTRALSHLIPTIHTPVSYESLNKMRYICIKIVFAIVSWWRYLDSLDWEEQIIHKLFCTKVGRRKG
jgi:hypothetical protein